MTTATNTLFNCIKMIKEIPILYENKENEYDSEQVNILNILKKVKEKKNNNIKNPLNFDLDFSTGEIYDNIGKYIFSTKGTISVIQDNLPFKRYTTGFTPLYNDGYILIEEAGWSGQFYNNNGNVAIINPTFNLPIKITSPVEFDGEISFLVGSVYTIDDTNCDPDYFAIVMGNKEARISLNNSKKICSNNTGYDIEIEEVLYQLQKLVPSKNYSNNTLWKIRIKGHFPKSFIFYVKGQANQNIQDEAYMFIKYSTKLENVTNFNKKLMVGDFSKGSLEIENDEVENKMKFVFKLNSLEDREIISNILKISKKKLICGNKELIDLETNRYYEVDFIKNKNVFDIYVDKELKNSLSLNTKNLVIQNCVIKELKIFK